MVRVFFISNFFLDLDSAASMYEPLDQVRGCNDYEEEDKRRVTSGKLSLYDEPCRSASELELTPA